MKLPEKFDERGLLPPGDYELTLEALFSSILVEGPDHKPIHWDAHWRRKLVINLAIIANQLWSVGVDNLFIDGSFVEEKNHPNDIDGYFECDPREFGRIIRTLNEIDPHKSWTWPINDHPKMWYVYNIELFPHLGQKCGIDDVTGYPLEFPAAFRQSRDFQPKGIIKIIPERR